jgi:hypothetical protein
MQKQLKGMNCAWLYSSKVVMKKLEKRMCKKMPRNLPKV